MGCFLELFNTQRCMEGIKKDSDNPSAAFISNPSISHTSTLGLLLSKIFPQLTRSLQLTSGHFKQSLSSQRYNNECYSDESCHAWNDCCRDIADIGCYSNW